jgi:hypothetical protein
MDWRMRVTAVVESLASKPAPFRDRRDAALEYFTAFVWLMWKDVPPATRKFNGIRLDGVDG